MCYSYAVCKIVLSLQSPRARKESFMTKCVIANKEYVYFYKVGMFRSRVFSLGQFQIYWASETIYPAFVLLPFDNASDLYVQYISNLSY